MSDIDKYIAAQQQARPVEASAIRYLCRELKANGTPVTRVWDGESYETVSTHRDVLNMAFNLDELRLHTSRNSWVAVVMGESPEDMAYDYTTDLDAPMGVYYAWAEGK